jgi:pimeloyl-ACP methyl ester carboxylesterase
VTGPTSRTYFSQRLRLHYVDWGNADKPPLLLIHGGRDHCRNWDWAAAALGHDWHVMAPDLRGHGDSQWSADGSYSMAGYVYDLAQLVHQQTLAPVTIIAHSLGGNVALRYAGIYPNAVSALVAIEGLGPSPTALAARRQKTIAERMDQWIQEQRGLAGRLPRRYASIEDAFRRMQEENPHLSAEQARHLTAHRLPHAPALRHREPLRQPRRRRPRPPLPARHRHRHRARRPLAPPRPPRRIPADRPQLSLGPPLTSSRLSRRGVRCRRRPDA